VVGRERDTPRAVYKDYNWLARLCCAVPGDTEQPSRRTADFNSAHRDIRKVISSAANASEDSV